jgi:hypothetical protein
MPALPADNVGMRTKVSAKRKAKSKPLQYTLLNIPPAFDQVMEDQRRIDPDLWR